MPSLGCKGVVPDHPPLPPPPPPPPPPPNIHPLSSCLLTQPSQELGDKPHIDCADLLLKAGASTTLKDKSGKTALDWCGVDNSLIAAIKDEEELRERKKNEGRRGFW